MTKQTDKHWSEEAERAVIGAVTLRPEAYERADLEPDEFYHPGHREIWSAMGRLRAAGKPVDLALVLDELVQSSVPAGVELVSSCMGDALTADNVEHYAEIVRRDALTRRVRLRVGDAMAAGHSGEELLGAVYEAVAGAEQRARDDAALALDVVPARYCAMVKRLVAQDAGDVIRMGVTTGLADLDWALGGGLPAGAVTVLGGRPSHGKSSLARTIADSASRAGYGVHFFSLEDERDALADRILADYARVNLHSLRTLELSATEQRNLEQAAASFQDRRNWLIDDAAALSSSQIAIRVRRHKRDIGTQLVVVDYLQLVEETGTENRRAEVNKALRGLINLARTERVAVLLLSQLTRANEREERPPRLSDLRESGDIEQVARAVLFVWQWETKDGTRHAEVRVAKNKHGVRDQKVQVYWDAKTATYRSAPRSEAA